MNFIDDQVLCQLHIEYNLIMIIEFYASQDMLTCQFAVGRRPPRS